MSRASRQAFRDRLDALGFTSYADYLASPHWRTVRGRFEGMGCRGCGGRATQLHHLTYERMGKEKASDLVPLCRDCHAFVHDSEDPADPASDLREVTRVALRKVRRRRRPGST